MRITTMNQQRLSKTLLTAVATTAAILAFSMEHAYAGGGGGHHGEPHISHLFWFWINFLVFFGILFKLVKNPFKLFWQDRREAIKNHVERGQRELEQAQADLEAANEKHQQLNQDVEKLFEEMKKETHREAADMIDQAKQQASRIAEQARLLAKAEKLAADKAVRNDLVTKVLAKAEHQLKDTITEESDRFRRQANIAHLATLNQ